jgi:hypothetical protein
MIALPHLLFLTTLYVAGLVFWLFRLDTLDTPLLVGGAVVAGIGAGIFLGAWT